MIKFIRNCLMWLGQQLHVFSYQFFPIFVPLSIDTQSFPILVAFFMSICAGMCCLQLQVWLCGVSSFPKASQWLSLMFSILPEGKSFYSIFGCRSNHEKRQIVNCFQPIYRYRSQNILLTALVNTTETEVKIKTVNIKITIPSRQNKGNMYCMV